MTSGAVGAVPHQQRESYVTSALGDPENECAVVLLPKSQIHDQNPVLIPTSGRQVTFKLSPASFNDELQINQSQLNPLAPFINFNTISPQNTDKQGNRLLMNGNFQLSAMYQYKPIVDEFRERYAQT